MRPDEQPDQGLEEIMATFERHEVAYVVIGGEAARARGWPEQTEDVDVTPERSQENLSRLADALEELEAGFRLEPDRYPDGFRPPGGIDWRTFRSQVWVTLTTRHGDIDIVLTPDGTDGYQEIAQTATREHRDRRARRLGGHDPAIQDRSRSSQGPRRARPHARHPESPQATRLAQPARPLAPTRRARTPPSGS
jgi:hypothetical protein